MFTANTMSSAIEALGMSVPGTSSRPALASSTQAVDDSVKALFVCMERNITARDIMSVKAFENAITMVYALGGSTNAYLHLLALARECDLEEIITIDRLHEIGYSKKNWSYKKKKQKKSSFYLCLRYIL